MSIWKICICGKVKVYERHFRGQSIECKNIFQGLIDLLVTLEQIIQVTGSLMDSKCLLISIMIQRWYPTQEWDNFKAIQISAYRLLTEIVGKLALLYLAYKYVIKQIWQYFMTKAQNHANNAQLIVWDVLQVTIVHNVILEKKSITVYV